LASRALASTDHTLTSVIDTILNTHRSICSLPREYLLHSASSSWTTPLVLRSRLAAKKALPPTLARHARATLARHACSARDRHIDEPAMLCSCPHTPSAPRAGQHAGTRCTFPPHPPSLFTLSFSLSLSSPLHRCTSLFLPSSSPLLVASFSVRPPFCTSL